MKVPHSEFYPTKNTQALVKSKPKLVSDLKVGSYSLRNLEQVVIWRETYLNNELYGMSYSMFFM